MWRFLFFVFGHNPHSIDPSFLQARSLENKEKSSYKCLAMLSIFHSSSATRLPNFYHNHTSTGREAISLIKSPSQNHGYGSRRWLEPSCVAEYEYFVFQFAEEIPREG